jgi:ribose 5-phosphate isomerase
MGEYAKGFVIGMIVGLATGSTILFLIVEMITRS